MMASMRKGTTSRYKIQHYQLTSNIEEINAFIQEKGENYLIPFFDKADLDKLALVNKTWESLVNSRFLFSTIFKSIKDVVEEVKT